MSFRALLEASRIVSCPPRPVAHDARPGAARAGYAAGSPAYRRIVGALMAGGLANFSLMYFVQPLLPMLAEHYRVTAAESSHALSITTLTIIARAAGHRARSPTGWAGCR